MTHCCLPPAHTLPPARMPCACLALMSSCWFSPSQWQSLVLTLKLALSIWPQQLMGCLLFSKKLHLSPYADVLAQHHWEGVIRHVCMWHCCACFEPVCPTPVDTRCTRVRTSLPPHHCHLLHCCLCCCHPTLQTCSNCSLESVWDCWAWPVKVLCTWLLLLEP